MCACVYTRVCETPEKVKGAYALFNVELCQSVSLGACVFLFTKQTSFGLNRPNQEGT